MDQRFFSISLHFTFLEIETNWYHFLERKQNNFILYSLIILLLCLFSPYGYSIEGIMVNGSEVDIFFVQLFFFFSL